MEIQRRENRCILKIKDCQPDDEAEYSCTCGDAKTSTQFSVTGKGFYLLCHELYSRHTGTIENNFQFTFLNWSMKNRSNNLG